jgi:NADH pyrophosphatase NudC (nudix superfamily)
MAAPASLPLLLDWGHKDHWSHTAKPCRYCGRPVHLRDDRRHPACKTCAEQALARTTGPPG